MPISPSLSVGSSEAQRDGPHSGPLMRSQAMRRPAAWSLEGAVGAGGSALRLGNALSTRPQGSTSRPQGPCRLVGSISGEKLSAVRAPGEESAHGFSGGVPRIYGRALKPPQRERRKIHKQRKNAVNRRHRIKSKT